MAKLSELLMRDVRFREGLTACMNCGVCTAICPAAEFYKYDPRQICTIVQSKDEDKIEELLRSETIWYCGQCMSCKTRCPRGNAPGLVINALRGLSQELGYFTDSEKDTAGENGASAYHILEIIRRSPSPDGVEQQYSDGCGKQDPPRAVGNKGLEILENG